MKRSRVAFAVAALAVLLTGLGMIPIPSRIHVPAIAELDSDHRVYVQVDGRIVESVRPDTHVRVGDTLAVLQNDELQAELLEIEGDIKIQRQHLDSLRWRSNNNPEAAAQIPAAESALADLVKRQQVLQRQTEQLTVRAPSDGVVLSAPRKFEEGSSERFLATWTGSPLDPENRGGVLERGELLCLIASPSALQARLIVHQDQIELIEAGSEVAILFDGTSLHSVRGRVDEVSSDQEAEIPRNLATKKSLEVVRQKDGTLALARGGYSATVELQDPSGMTILPGTCGQAVVIGRSQTLWQVLARFVQLNFRFFA